RASAYMTPEDPPYFGLTTIDRRNHMWHRAERDPELQHRIQQTWLPMFTFLPPYGGPGLDELFLSVKADVDKITARGGKVVFIRFPSTEDLRQLEQELWPRDAFWDRLIAETGAPGIHFEDYADLSGFWCPEWSHLSRVDAVTFTRNLIPHIREKLANSQ
ncbi:MAG TPA: hypothetical protein VK995_05055, partial [Oceanipulchritudo sp.]|nr:hypothetical protein [Oceanipulchritudo sp.]